VSQVTLRAGDAFDLDVGEQPGDVDAVLAALPERLQADHYRLWYLPHVDRVWEWRARCVRTGSASARRAVLHRRARFGRWWRDRVAQPGDRPPCLRTAVGDEPLPATVTPGSTAGTRGATSNARRGSPSIASFSSASASGPCRSRRERTRCKRSGASWHGHSGPDMLSCRRPHWAKEFTAVAADLAPRYAHWDAFQQVRADCDPDGMFENDFSRRVLGPSPT